MCWQLCQNANPHADVQTLCLWNYYLIYRHRMPRRQNSRCKSRLQRVCRVQWQGILFMGCMTFHIQHVSLQLAMIDAPVLAGKKKKKVSHYTQTGVSIPVNPYINFAVSLWFIALKEFVPAPQTHVSLCRTVGGHTWRQNQEYHWTIPLHCSTHFLLSSQLLV